MAVEIIDLSTEVEQLGLQGDTGKEVYETSDVEETPDQVVITEANEDIIEEEIPKVQENNERFEHSVLSSEDTDFSGKLYALPTYNIRHINETRRQRLARIRRELLEIEQDSEEDGSSNELQNLKQLYEMLAQSTESTMENIQSQLVIASDEDTENEVTLPNIRIEINQLKQLEDIEHKISILESQIGPSNTNKSITSIINELHREINILKLDEPTLTGFQNKMKEISDQYDQSIIGRRAQKDPNLSTDIERKLKSTESKVNDIYDKYNILNKYSEVIPQITERVQSLNVLHTSVNDMNDTVSEINDHMSSVHSQIEKWSSLLESTSRQLTDREQSFKRTRHQLELQLNDLEVRIGKLSGQ